MARRLLLSIFSIAIAIHAWAQIADTTAMAGEAIPASQQDSGSDQSSDSTIFTPRRFLSPSLYLDYGKLLSLPSDFEQKYEGGIELLFLERLPVIVEVGRATLTPSGAYTNGTYQSEGTYFRVGTGYSSQLTPKNRISLTARYASSTFNEDGRIFIESASGTQDIFTQVIERKNLTASWWEIVFYSDQRLLKKSDLFSVGLNLRLRILQRYDQQEEIDVYAIPGYGRSFDRTIPVANLFFKINL